MQVSTKLFNDQQVRQFGKLTADIQQKQEKIASGKAILRASDDPVAAVQLSAPESKNSYFPDLKKMHIRLRTD
ncbi:MAG: hypothetical protein CM15mP119_2090 [Alphaproteobacteria bacterium]|nr:MAG: hypothetical protein CM15mP119_2090 [Alphaproteobacteria bacterium]